MKIKLVNLTKKFFSIRGECIALDNLNLEIDDKEFFVLLGPSGCGKSTLLNLIAGLERPTAGEIWFGDKLVASNHKKFFLPPKERNVAMVFQSYALYPHLKVFENIAFPLRIQKTKENEIEEAVKKAAEMLDITCLLNVKPAELSGGQRQRVAIARAMVRHPDIFLLDEPLSNLDAQLRVSTRSELKQLQKKLGVTTIYVTHDQAEAMSLGDRIAVLKNGKIEQIGTPEELYEKPATPFIAKFIGSPPMNLIETTLIEENNEYFVVIGSDNKLKIPNNKLKGELPKNKKLILGIRPEDIYIHPFGSLSNGVNLDKNIFRVKIVSTESSGREEILQVLLAKEKVFVLSNRKELRNSEIIDIEINVDKLHFFY